MPLEDQFPQMGTILKARRGTCNLLNPLLTLQIRSIYQANQHPILTDNTLGKSR